MAAVAARVAALAVALAALCTAQARSQALATLHVRSMVLSASPDRVRLGDLLRLALRVHVDERVGRLDDVTLPDLVGFDVLGDERRCERVRKGTDCTETLSLAPNAAGTYRIGPVWLDARDPHSGRPTRYGSNVVNVTVTGAGTSTRVAAGLAAATLRVIGVLLIVAAATLLVLLGLRIRRRVPKAPPMRPRPPAVVMRRSPIDDEARWRTMIDHLRMRPSRARVDAVRAVLRKRVGARPGETFGDLAARGAQLEEPSAMEALRLIERAAFIDDDHLPAAVMDALPALESVAGMKRVTATSPEALP